MMLSAGDVLVISAALKAQAMAWGEKAKRDMAQHRAGDAAQAAAFSGECARLAEMFDKRN